MLLRRFSVASSFLVLGAAASWVAIGCSSSATSSDTVAAADAGAEDATIAPDSSDTDAAVADAGQADASGHSGNVYVISDSTAADGGTASHYRAGASFVRASAPDTSTVTRTIGPCEVATVSDATPSEIDVSAGAVHIEGGSANLVLMPTASATYDPLSAASLLFTGGEILTARADGKDVPAFTTKLTAPSQLTMSAPTPSMGAITITKSDGLTATFSGASSGQIVLYFSGATSTNAYSAKCKFAGTAATAHVPAEALADLPAGNGFFDFYVEASSDVAPSGWNVHFAASKAIVDSTGAALQGDALFQ